MDEESLFSNTYFDDDPLKDLYPRFEEELLYLDHLEKSQQDSRPPTVENISPINSEHHETQTGPSKMVQNKNEDYDCQICGDGDYNDDN